jgi:hypothetical protein
MMGAWGQASPDEDAYYAKSQGVHMERQAIIDLVTALRTLSTPGSDRFKALTEVIRKIEDRN